MKRVYQTVRHNPPDAYGNCYRACVASILEIGIDEIPPFETMAGFNDAGASGADWWHAYTGFLKGLGLFASRHSVESGLVPLGYSILTGQSPRFIGGHCVVCHDGKQIHDPAGIGAEKVTEYWDFEVLIPIDATEVRCMPVKILDKHGDWTMKPEVKS